MLTSHVARSGEAPSPTPAEAERREGAESFLRSARSASLGTLLSRVLGLVRDVLSAALIGAGLHWDAFVIAFTVPNLFRRLFGEGALSSAFVSVHAEHLAKNDREGAARTVNVVATALVLLLTAIVVVGVLLLALVPVERLVAPESAPKASLVAALSAIMFPYLLLVCFTAFLMAVLNGLGRFGVAAATPAALNALWIVVLVGGLVFAVPVTTLVFVLAGVVVAAGFLQIAMLVPSLRQAGVRVRPDFRFRDPSLRRVFALMLPVVLGLAPTQLNVLVDQYIAEAFIPGDGANSALYYGNRLMQFPLALIGIAVGTAAFPLLARLAASNQRDAMAGVANLAMRVAFFVALPAAVGLFVLAEPIVRLFFEWGRFGPEATARTTPVLAAFAIGVPAFCALQIVTRSHYALRDTKTPMRIGLAAMGLNVVMNLALVGPLGAAGLALATSVSALLNFAGLTWVLRSRLGRIGGRALLRSIARTTALALAMGLVCAGVAWAATSVFGTASLGARLAAVAAPVAAGALLFALGARALALPEAIDILASFARRRAAGSRA